MNEQPQVVIPLAHLPLILGHFDVWDNLPAEYRKALLENIERSCVEATERKLRGAGL